MANSVVVNKQKLKNELESNTNIKFFKNSNRYYAMAFTDEPYDKTPRNGLQISFDTQDNNMFRQDIVNNVVTNLQVFHTWSYSGNEIPNGINIDELKSRGKWYVSNTANVSTLSGDLPFTSGFSLFIFTTAYDWVHEIAMPSGGIDIKHRYFDYNQNQWSQWYSIQQTIS